MLVGIIWVLLAGCAINAHNTGGVSSAAEAFADTKAAFENSHVPDRATYNQ